tara:strand:+ start:46 stop:441 length:396 start_codon:yes stop_codon:yes gene_type:complete
MQPRQPDDKELAKLYRWTLHTRWGVLDDRDAAGQYAASVGELNALRAMIVQPQLDRQFEAHFRGRFTHQGTAGDMTTCGSCSLTTWITRIFALPVWLRWRLSTRSFYFWIHLTFYSPSYNLKFSQTSWSTI